MKLKELYKTSWDKDGLKDYLNQLSKECFELLNVIIEFYREKKKGKTREELKDIVDHFTEEMVDVRIKIDTIIQCMGLEKQASDWKDVKIKELTQEMGG